MKIIDSSLCKHMKTVSLLESLQSGLLSTVPTPWTTPISCKSATCPILCCLLGHLLQKRLGTNHLHESSVYVYTENTKQMTAESVLAKWWICYRKSQKISMKCQEGNMGLCLTCQSHLQNKWPFSSMAIAFILAS